MFPAKCAHFADKNMLRHIDPGALSYRRNGSISTESALEPRSGIAFSRLGFADLFAAGIERGDRPLVSMGSVRRTRTLVSEETGRHRPFARIGYCSAAVIICDVEILEREAKLGGAFRHLSEHELRASDDVRIARRAFWNIAPVECDAQSLGRQRPSQAC